MEREIKFRAWLGDKMQYGVTPFQWDYVLTTMSHKCIESNGNGILGSGGTEAKFEVGGYSLRNGGVIEQYTGLKDKNGKEIYEGDIVIVNGLTGFVKYLGCSFMIEWIGADVYSDLLGWDDYKRGKVSEGKDYEIIGNIHEQKQNSREG
jgi:uncharacterized phage protein (TIGR01671 family)